MSAASPPKASTPTAQPGVFSKEISALRGCCSEPASLGGGPPNATPSGGRGAGCAALVGAGAAGGGAVAAGATVPGATGGAGAGSVGVGSVGVGPVGVGPVGAGGGVAGAGGGGLAEAGGFAGSTGNPLVGGLCAPA